MHLHDMENRTVHKFIVIDQVRLPVVIHKRGIMPLRDIGMLPPAPGVARHDAKPHGPRRVVFIDGFDRLVSRRVYVFSVDRSTAEYTHIVSPIRRVAAVGEE